MGVDVSERMLRAARRKLGAAPNAWFVQTSAADLPLDDAAFDVVVS